MVTNMLAPMAASTSGARNSPSPKNRVDWPYA